MGGVGRFGEFGADPSIAAPVIGATEVDYSALLQTSANPAMVSNSITIDQANGIVTFEFDWGATGFVPTANTDASGHFNRSRGEGALFRILWFELATTWVSISKAVHLRASHDHYDSRLRFSGWRSKKYHLFMAIFV